MTTRLDGELRRELVIARQPYTLTLSPAGFTLALKGRRKGLAIQWADLVSGDVALATALNASLTANIAPPAPGSKSRTVPPAEIARTLRGRPARRRRA